MVVLVIGAILAAIATPSFENLSRNLALNGAANEIASGLQFARSEALQRGRSLVFKLEQRKWQVFQDVNSNEVYDASEELLREGAYSSKIEELANAVVVRYTPGGTGVYNAGVHTHTAYTPGASTCSGDLCICLEVTGHPAPRLVRVRKLGRPSVLGGAGAEQHSQGAAVATVCP
jgi:Tfp pilus assembly protein FimT